MACEKGYPFSRVKIDLEASIITSKSLGRDTIKKVYKDLKKYDKYAVMHVTKFEEVDDLK